jgi:uncharacterized membrane protein YfcA
MVLDIKEAIPLIVLVAGTMNLVLLIQLWRHVRWEQVRPLLLGALPGIALGVLFLKGIDETTLRVSVGSVLILYVVYSLVGRQDARGIHERWAYVFGFLAGGLGGAFGIVGPPLIAYVSLQPWDKHEIKALLQGVFFLAGGVIIAFHAFMGLTTGTVLRFLQAVLSLSFMPSWG